MPFLLNILFSSFHFFWLLLSLLLGALYAWLLYKPLGKLRLTYSLFALRCITVAALFFLLSAPLINRISRSVEKPLIILAQDNSSSIKISPAKGFDFGVYKNALNKLQQALAEDYEVKTVSFGSKVNPGLRFAYNEPSTDIAAVFKTVTGQFSGRNIGAVILASDGIYNTGDNPVYLARQNKFPVYTIALGDTIPKRDVVISTINYNRIVYLDNKFEVEVFIDAYQCAGQSTNLTIADSSGVIFSKPVAISSGSYHTIIRTALPAKKKGIQKFTFRLSPVSGELSAENNTQHIFVDVLDDRQNILIIANAPHPDISALKQSIESNKGYEVKTTLAADVKPQDIAKAGLIILHQLPSQTQAAQDIFKAVQHKPCWFILGAQSDVNRFSQMQHALSISGNNTVQETTARPNTGFFTFAVSDSTLGKIQNFAPLTAPFGNYTPKAQSTVLLNQQVGKIVTANPLLLFSDENQRKIAVLTGEGIWRWRLNDFAEHNNHDAVNELVSKIIQYLSARDDQRKFRVYPTQNAFPENLPVQFNAELYTDAYQLINTPEVSLTVKNKQNKTYNYLFTRNQNAYVLNAGTLPAGEYTFSAATQLANHKLTASGRFIVEQQLAELQQTTANHQLLFQLAQATGGSMLYPGKIAQLPELLKKNELIKSVSYEDKRYEDMINLKAVAILLLLLLSAEWFLRKRNGEV
ncbi:VWA domain-containing protein [Pedobacter sp. BS3]|uniref:VWA domain-containing protein n=1 Tax=Pedobacter sp. BS3 TaxID=2567937 RepID=UPI0011EFAFEF|nr:VWA domain-containing protein [Pedobacter sp. BS3]TZF83221.1 VWA domain-containing protein [Pedobacter sp. BS3]